MAPLRQLQLFTFLGAALLFGLEPLTGRLLLPSFGGGFPIWATCLMFFQAMLLAGYLYCHLLAGRLGRWHLLLACAPLLLLPLSDLRTIPDPERPLGALLSVLFAGVALPFGVLATTGVVAQQWLARSDLPERDEPYQLYAASNLGSLVALLGYPLVVEPLLGLSAQRGTWSAGFVLYLALAAWVGLRVVRRGAPPAPAPEPAAAPLLAQAAPTARPGWRAWSTWFLLATAPSMFLMAVTNVIAMDVGSVPLVWVVPLGLYLLTFILAFGRRPVCPQLVRRFWLEIAVVGIYFFSLDGGVSWVTALIHLAALFTFCLVAHSELHRLRPAPEHLSAFYLLLSLGGFVGGVFVAILAPILLPGLWEYPLSVALLALTLLVVRRGDFVEFLRQHPWPLLFGSTLLFSLVGARMVQEHIEGHPALVEHRNFYGVYTVGERPVVEDPEGAPPRTMRYLRHGTTLHGRQLTDPEGRRIPIGYYHTESPLGNVMRMVRETRGSLRGAVIGMGTGTTAAYFRAGDALTFFELDPDVPVLARQWFTYLSDCEARLDVVVGDAMVSLRAPAAEKRLYDVILVDAFSSDAIPTHLLTREALALYADRLAPGGVLVFHVSNRYYDLRPVLAATAASSPELRLLGAFKGRGAPDLSKDGFEDASDYFAFVRDEKQLTVLDVMGWQPVRKATNMPVVAPWTDDYANLLAPMLVRARGWPPAR